MKYQKGDTLIEVTLAIGVFSMIAIAVVAVMNSGTSGAQSSLETTLAREEIDAQAEALRFIQASYINDKGVINASENRFQNLWQEITNLAVEPDLKVDADGDGVKDDDIAKFTPNTCQALYNNQYLNDSNAFIINTRYLGDFTTGSTASVKNSSNGDSAIFIKKESSFFQPASTYPRLIFRSNSGDNNLIDSVSSTASKRLYRAEGIFIVAVKDADKTTIVGDTGAIDKKSAFYDFYIRTCWYGAGTNTPSTISTVIRLYDPDAIAERDGEIISFSANGGKGIMPQLFVPAGKTKTLPLNTFKWGDVDESLYNFVGWSTNSLTTVAQVNSGASGTYKNGANYTAPSSTFSRKSKTLYAVWDIEKFWVDVNLLLDDVRYNSGLADFKVKSYIDGVYIDESNNGIVVDGTTVSLNDHDFYQPVNFGSKVRVELFDVPGYTLDTSHASLCRNISPCSIKTFDGGTAVEFTVNSVPEGTVINDSNQYAINIEPHWTTNPPEGP